MIHTFIVMFTVTSNYSVVVARMFTATFLYPWPPGIDSHTNIHTRNTEREIEREEKSDSRGRGKGRSIK